MPFSRPTLLELVNRTRNDLFSHLAEDDPLRFSDAEAYARVLAGGAHELYGYLDWLARQLMPDTAETEHLERWANIWGVARKAATKATGTITFTGVVGASAATGTILQALDGVQYQTIEDAIITVSSDVAAVEAVNAGAAGNRAAGETFTLTSPISGLSAGALASAMSGGADVEDDEALRARLLFRIRNPPQGGAETDYIQWALQVPGVTRAWAVGLQLGAGTVVVRFVRDGESPIIPDSTEVAAVQAWIDPLRPVTAAVTVVAPIAQPVNIQVSGPDNITLRAVVEDAIAAVFRYDVTPGYTLLFSNLEYAVREGGADFSLVSPSADVTATSAGHLHTLGTITWV